MTPTGRGGVGGGCSWSAWTVVLVLHRGRVSAPVCRRLCSGPPCSWCLFPRPPFLLHRPTVLRKDPALPFQQPPTRGQRSGPCGSQAEMDRCPCSSAVSRIRHMTGDSTCSTERARPLRRYFV